jgi:MFS family permease
VEERVRETLRARALVPVLLFVGTVAALVSSLGAPLIPTIAEVHRVSLTAAQWSLTITLLVAAVATPTLGRLGDGPHRKRALVGALVVVLIGCVLAALPLGFVALITGRALQGLGLGLTPLVVAVAHDHLPSARIRPTVAMLSLTTVAGLGFGYPLTGLLTDLFGLAAGFWFGAALCAVAALLAAWIVPRPQRPTRQRFDLLGAVLLGAGLGAALVALSEGPGWGATSWRLLTLVAVALVLLAAWVRHELATTVPLVDVRLLRHRPVLTAAVTGLLTGVGMYLLLSMVTRFVQTPANAGYGFGASVVMAGLVLLPFSLASMAGSRVSTLIARHVRPRAVLPVGCAIILVATAGFALAHDALWQVFVVMGVAGLGVGCTYAALPGLILPAVPASETGSAMGFNQVLRMAGFSVGSALSAAILELYTPADRVLPSEAGYEAASMAGVGIWVVAVILSLVLPGRPRGRRPRSAGAADRAGAESRAPSTLAPVQDLPLP